MSTLALTRIRLRLPRPDPWAISDLLFGLSCVGRPLFRYAQKVQAGDPVLGTVVVMAVLFGLFTLSSVVMASLGQQLRVRRFVIGAALGAILAVALPLPAGEVVLGFSNLYWLAVVGGLTKGQLLRWWL